MKHTRTMQNSILARYPATRCEYRITSSQFELTLDPNCAPIALADTERHAWRKAYALIEYAATLPRTKLGLARLSFPSDIGIIRDTQQK